MKNLLTLILTTTLVFIVVGCSRIKIPQNESYSYSYGSYTHAFNEIENQEISLALSKASWHTNWVTYAPIFPEIKSKNSSLMIVGNNLVGRIMGLNSVYCEIPNQLSVLLDNHKIVKPNQSTLYETIDREVDNGAEKNRNKPTDFIRENDFKLIK